MKRHAPFLPTLLLLSAVLPLAGRGQTLGLRDVIRHAEATHPRIHYAEAGADATRARRLQALSPESPTLSYSEEEIPGPGGIGDGMMRYYTISQAFDIPLLIGARAWKYRHLERADALRLARARRAARADAIVAYAEASVAFRKREILLLNQLRLDTLAEFASKRTAAGQASRLEELRFRAERADAHVSYTRAEEASISAERRLRVLMGNAELSAGNLQHTDLEAVLAVGDPQMTGYPPPDPALDEARAARSDASWRWLEYLPRFSASWFRQEAVGAGWFWGAEFSAQVPLWFLLGERGRAEEAEAEARAAEAAATLAQREWIDAHLAALGELRASRNAARTYADMVKTDARDILRAVEVSFAAGRISYMEMLDALRSAHSMELAYLDALLDFGRAVAEYERTSGTTLIND